ncbi:retrovirus-related pol polyprotein from transposon TNT 1-94 [Tanacetum coccineum]
MFDRAFKRVNTFEDFRTELVEGKEKRAGTELASRRLQRSKRKEDDKEIAEIKKFNGKFQRRRGASLSTTIDHDAPSPSTSPNNETIDSLIHSTNVEQPLNKEDAEFDSDTFTNPFAHPETTSSESSSRIVDTSNMHTFQQPQINTKRWTKDHPLVTVIGDPSKPISIRRELATDAMWCYFHAFLTKVEPKNYKEAMTESSWIEAMQEEIHEFERLEVWELVPRPSNIMKIALKWIFKVKLGEYRGVLKNKARLVAKGFCQEEGIDFEESFHLSLALKPLEYS